MEYNYASNVENNCKGILKKLKVPKNEYFCIKNTKITTKAKLIINKWEEFFR